MSLSKLYKSQMAAFSRDSKYTLAEAINILKSMPHAKFDETVELAIKLGVDTRKSDQTVRGAVALPRGTGKSVKVAVVADGAQTEEAKAQGISNCPHCAMGHEANRTKIWKLNEMDADHVAAWSKGGATDISNCQMLCKTHNRAKGNK